MTPREDPSGREGEREPLSVQVRFDRLPGSLRGAFVLRGADGDPHAIQFTDARVQRVPAGSSAAFPFEERVFDVAPTRDLFVPFEAPIGDLPPGWYTVEAAIRVDGGRARRHAGRRFCVPWPRADVRRGTLRVGEGVRVGRVDVRVERVEMNADSAAVVWSVAEGVDTGDLHAALRVDGGELEILPDAGRDRGETDRATVSYPVPRSARSLEVVVRGAGGAASAPVAVRGL